MKRKSLIAGFFLGFIVFLHLCFLLALTLHFFFNKNIFLSQFTSDNLFYMITGFLLVIFFSALKLHKIINNFNELIDYAEKNRLIEFIEFLFFSILMVLLFILILRLNLSQKELLKNGVFILLFLVFGSMVFNKIFEFFISIMLLNILYPDTIGSTIALGKEYSISNNKEFLEKSRALMNQAKRFNFDLGIIVLYFPDMNKIQDVQHNRFLRKQLNFLLLQHSRDYEPWGITGDKDLYVKLISARNKGEIINASERFFSVLKQHPFYILHKPVQVDFKMLGVYLRKSDLESDELDFVDEFLLILNQNYEMIKEMDEDLKIIDIE